MGMSGGTLVLIGLLQVPQIAPEQVSFGSSDDVTVYGDLYRVDAPLDGSIVLLLHQSASNTTEFAPVVPHLLRRGFHVLAIDARGGGVGACEVHR